MNKSRKARIFVHLVFSFFLAGAVVFFDQWTKAWAIKNLSVQQHDVITPFFNLVLHFNRGISFGLLNESNDLWQTLLAGLLGGITIGLAIWLCLTKERLIMYSLGIVVGGSVGNLIDRWQRGAVTDFLQLHWNNLAWPAFNVADAAICLGMFVIVLLNWQKNDKAKSSRKTLEELKPQALAEGERHGKS